MEELFAALIARHPGHSVLDVQFTVLGNSPCEDITSLDATLAEAIKEAEETDLTSIFG